MKFTGTDGREYIPALTLGALRRFERQTGVKLFEAMRDNLPENLGALTDTDSLKLIAAIVPGVEEAAAFFFACCVDPSAKDAPSFEEFCDAMPINVLPKASECIFEQLAQFMPTVEGGAQQEGADPSSGGTSGSSRA